MTTLWCLHGFLQDGSVWNRLAEDLSGRTGRDNILVKAPSIVTQDSDSLEDWATRFCKSVEESGTHLNVLLGYSMGGRLGMHAFLKQPDLWETAIIVSAHPGLADSAQRKVALERDEQWADRFSGEPLVDVLRDWDSQPIFNGSTPPNRPVIDAQQAALQLRDFSKGRQRDLQPELTSTQRSFHYVTGARDEKYVEIGRQLSNENPHCSHVITPNAGHRVPWDNHSGFAAHVVEILAT